MRAGLGSAWRRFLAVVATIGIVLILLVAWMGPYERSPLRLIDTSNGEPDSNVCQALERALKGGVEPPPRVSRFLPEVALPLESMSDLEFRRRVASVPAWDQLVAYPPYQRGEELMLDPSISSWWLKRRLRATDGFETEHVLYLLVIREQRVVGSLILGTDLEVAGVITRLQ